MFMLDEVGTAVLKTCKQHFGWDVPFAVSVFPPGSSDAELAKQFFRELHGRIEREQADLVAIDGLSRLRAVLGAQFADRLGTFFRALQIKGITGLFSAEEPADRLEVEEYQADGIIHLRSGETGRTLEVEKLRGQSYAAAAHPFEILDLAALPNEGGPDGVSPTFNPYRPGINVYPNERFYASQAVADYGRPQPAPGSDVSMGIPGLDRLLGGSRNGKHGYSEGDSILVLGSAGAGKTLFGLHFLKTEIEQRARAATATEPLKPGVLWLSFEGPKISLERATATFDETVGYKGALKSLPYIFTPVALLVPEKILFYLANAAQRSAERPGLDLKRLVIDSVTEIETAFSNPSRFRRFMRTLVDLLSSLDSHDPPLS
jgi:KaiC/GvpD/RAD55 family RecA-like ATPase